jgi:hypothetical protein
VSRKLRGGLLDGETHNVEGWISSFNIEELLFDTPPLQHGFTKEMAEQKFIIICYLVQSRSHGSSCWIYHVIMPQDSTNAKCA